MKTQGYLVHSAIPMGRNSSLRIQDGAGMVVHVVQGEAWITQADDRRDYVVGAGGSFRIERDGAAMVDAIHAGEVSLAAPTPQNYARLITLKVAGEAPRVLYDARQRGSWLAGLRYRFRFLEKRRLNPGAL